MSTGDGNWIINPTEFFREKVAHALGNQQISVCAEVEFYIVNLLCAFISPAKHKTAEGEWDLMDTPLAIMFKHALEAPPEKQMGIYKTMGDTSLYMSGYFQDYFNSKTFDMNYYMSLGSHAYNNVAALVRNHKEKQFRKIYKSLAVNFPALVEVVAEVSEQSGMKQDSDLLALYDKWSRNNSERLRKKLSEQGINPVPVNTRETQ